MSKIGKINISIPEKVKVALAGSNLNIEGPIEINSLIKRIREAHGFQKAGNPIRFKEEQTWDSV